MYERKPYSLPHFCVQYQLPCGVVCKIQTEDPERRNRSIPQGTCTADRIRERVHGTAFRMRRSGPCTLFYYGTTETVRHTDRKVPERHHGPETVRTVPGDTRPVMERAVMEPFLLLRDSRLRIGRKHTPVYRAPGKILLRRKNTCCWHTKQF